MSELSQILDELVSCGEGLIRAVNALREMYAADEPSISHDEAAHMGTAKAKTYSFIDVRKAFSAKSHAGFTDQIKMLITKYGADKLSAVKEEDYPAIMADLEAIE
jgi:hypothetical protein